MTTVERRLQDWSRTCADAIAAHVDTLLTPKAASGVEFLASEATMLLVSATHCPVDEV